MFLQIPSNFKNLWAYYHLTTNTGEIVNVGIRRFAELTDLNDIIPQEGLFLTVIDTDEDQYKVANRAMSDVVKRGKPSLQWTVQTIVTSWKKSANSARPVRCVETGITYNSASHAATADKLSYSQLINHLNNKIGFKTVKGKKYEWI